MTDVKAKQRKNEKLKKAKQDRLRVLKTIVKGDAPILKTICEDVKKEDVLDFVPKMARALFATGRGVGIAAPQIGVGKKLFILLVDRDKKVIKVVINPSIIEWSGVKITGSEGCLSYPDVYRNIQRDQKIKVKYLNEKFEEKEDVLTGYWARVFQHEYDHTNLGRCLVGLPQEEIDKVNMEVA